MTTKKISASALRHDEARTCSASAADRLIIARNAGRPTTREYIREMFDDFFEQAGDRFAGEDSAVLGGVALFHGLPVTVIGHQKGHTLSEKVEHRCGMPGPEGYRKAIRLMEQAEKFKRPVITFVDTPGAYPGREAEERGQGEAIARCIMTISRIRVPTVAFLTGEGGSGGALAFAAADRIIMLENSVFSVLSPEGFSSILWKDSSRWKTACEVMKMTAQDLQELGICDRVISETDKGAQGAPAYVFEALRRALVEELGLSLKTADEQTRSEKHERIFLEADSLLRKKPEQLVRERYNKLRNIGRIVEKN